jgi:hypothetical protein
MKVKSHTRAVGGKRRKVKSYFRKVKIVRRFKVGGRTYVERSPFTEKETPGEYQRKQKKTVRKLRM